MLYNVYLYWRKGEIGAKGALVWITIWGGLLFITFFPKYIEPLVKQMFFVRLFDLGNVMALIILAYVMFENHVRINKMQKQISMLVSKLAVKKVVRRK
ncbi:DUF2304 domain-containing protein [Candidatus Shapirobacteria bacterium]|nr:DUF2304 domain-containing protein [Candidatus Shapirobacteria bacterium]